MKQSNENQQENLHNERREQIKKVALKLFASQGLAGTKMSMIANEAGISQGLSYRYFKSKEEIFILLVQEAIDESQKSIKSVINLSNTPGEKIRILTENMLDDSHKHYFLLLQIAHTSDEVPIKVKQVLEQYSAEKTIKQLVPIILEGQQTGEFCLVDPNRLLFLYFSIITGLMLQDVQTTENYWVNEIDNIMKVLMK